MFNVLDHGYIKPIGFWGEESSIIEAARMSTGKGFKGWGPICAKCDERTIDVGRTGRCLNCGNGTYKEGDEKLLRFLYENKHLTPFEMAGVTIEVQAPIFVFREWHRHRTQSYNEMSARYTPLPDVNYIPSVERLMSWGGQNKQAQGTGATLTVALAEEFRGRLMDQYRQQQELYEMALTWGVPKELARVVLPVGRYSRMRASANLRNWLAFLTLREASNAQWEIRQYANALHKILASVFPRTLSLFEEGAK